MGESIIKQVEPINREVGTGTEGTGGDTKSKSPTNTGTRTGGTGGTGTGRTGGKTSTEKTVIPTVVNVDKEEQKRLERNAKRRERYAKQKAEGTLKPKKVNTKKQAKDETLGTEQITKLLKTVSMLIASRPNQQHWLLSDAEIKSIAEPLTKILQESKAFESIGEHSNAIALSIACITIILPRTIKSITDISKKKKKEKEVKKNVELRGSQRKNNTNDKRNNGNTTANGANSGTNAIWYGDAIS